jgi:hypothetical protein
MQNKASVIIIMILFFSSHICVSEEHFDFEEIINEDELKTIEVYVPDLRAKIIFAEDKTFTIKIGQDGLFRSISSTGGRNSYIYRRNTFLNVKNSWENPDITNIKWEGNALYVKGMSGVYFAADDFTRVNVNQGNKIIYEYDHPRTDSQKLLFKISDVSLYELYKSHNKNSIHASIFSNGNMNRYYRTGYRDWKLEYRPNGNNLSVVYFNMGEYPPIEIKLNNVILHSQHEYINVINYFLLENISHDLSRALFPLLFLEHPFSSSGDVSGWSYDATTFLTEGDTLYWSGNLSKRDGLPWASASGSGIGEKIIIDMQNNPANKLLIINGFVDSERPDLYNANSRLKEIQLTNLETQKHITVLLNDSKEPQVIDISELKPYADTIIELEILSVYEGIRYKDLCVQAILPGDIRR